MEVGLFVYWDELAGPSQRIGSIDEINNITVERYQNIFPLPIKSHFRLEMGEYFTIVDDNACLQSTKIVNWVLEILNIKRLLSS